MAPILAMAISEAKSLVGQIQTLVTKPPTAVAAPVGLDAGISAEQRALYAGSIVKLKSGKGFRATPIKAAVQLGTAARILGSSTGSVKPPASAIDQAEIESIALGVLSDPDDAAYKAAGGSLRAFGLETTLTAVVQAPFKELLVASGDGATPHTKPIEDALRMGWL